MAEIVPVQNNFSGQPPSLEVISYRLGQAEINQKENQKEIEKKIDETKLLLGNKIDKLSDTLLKTAEIVELKQQTDVTKLEDKISTLKEIQKEHAFIIRIISGITGIITTAVVLYIVNLFLKIIIIK